MPSNRTPLLQRRCLQSVVINLEQNVQSIDRLKMEAEVKTSTTLAIILSILSGIFMFIANMLISLAAQTATLYNQNMSIVTAISNGTVILGIAASFLIYKEKVSIM